MGFVANKKSGFVPNEPTTENKPGFSLDNLTNKKTEPIGGVGNAIVGAGLNPMTGVPRLALSAFGIPEEDTAPAVGTVLGTILGGQLGRPNLGAGVGATGGDLVKQAIEIGVRNNGKDLSVLDSVLKGGGVAATGKALELGGKAIGLSGKLIPDETRAKFFDKALQAVNIGKKQLSRNWDSAVSKLISENPEKRVNLSGPMTQIFQSIKGVDESIIPQIKSALSRNPKLAGMVDSPGKAINLTLQDAQEVKNAITSTTKSIINRAAKGQVTPAERGLFDILDSIDDKIVEQFPQMINVRQVYQAGKTAFDRARPLVEPGTSVEASIFNKPQGMFGLGGSPFMGSTHGKLAFRDITSLTTPGKKMYEASLLAHNLNRAADMVGRLGQIAVGGALATKVAQGLGFGKASDNV